LIYKKGVRMRKPVQDIYDRQLARCLSDIEELYQLPQMVEDRIKRAIEYTAKDIDKINNKGSGNGYDQQSNAHRQGVQKVWQN
jgi:hypothetical protein